MKASCGHHERNIRSPGRRGWCARDSGVETHAKWNLLHMKSINATSRLASLPSIDCGRKHHPTDLPAKCKPSSRICWAAIELHFRTLQVQRVCFEARSVRFAAAVLPIFVHAVLAVSASDGPGNSQAVLIDIARLCCHKLFRSDHFEPNS
jgi:hypothetical protein